MMNRTLLLFFLGIFMLNCHQSPQAPQSSPAPLSLDQIPVFSDFEDMSPIFNQQTDSVYVVNFWATWCKPCIAEMPYFEQLEADMQGKKVKIVLVSLDFEEHLESKLLPFLEKNKMPGEVMVLTDPDANDWINKVHPDWGGAIPVTLVYKGDQRSFVNKAFANYEELRNTVSALL